MSAKKPWVKSKICIWYFSDGKKYYTHRVRVTDARELTAEKAVERVLQANYDGTTNKGDFAELWANMLAEKAGMTATVKNGKVKVRRST